VTITDSALVAAATLADRYIADRHLPDKAIDLIDEAGSRVHLHRLHAVAEAGTDGVDVVDEESIAEILSGWTGIPVYRLTEEETARLARMEDELHRRVVGQDDATRAVSQAIRRTRAGLKDPKRPSGSFLFLGPSGVGKTELAKTLAEFLFGNEDKIVQLDMGEYQEEHTVSRLVGSPPGYVGYDEAGQLTETVRRQPFSVVLFDEIEKAHPDVFHALLQILEDGRLTDAQGRTVDFKNTVVILTSNLGTADLRKAKVGFARADEAGTYETMKDKVLDELKRQFRPEFLNRLDDVIVFHELSREEVTQIVDLMMRRVREQLDCQGLSLELTPAAKDHLAKTGYDPGLGARPLRRAIQHLVEDPLSERILGKEFQAGETIVVDANGDEIVLRRVESVEIPQDTEASLSVTRH
jgi:ATP-dependent Clp protease ATP-binding subunit ClpC